LLISGQRGASGAVWLHLFILDELASEYEGRVTVVKVNVDENPEYATQYVVQRTPTLIFDREE
jgi:thioredoxin-like negative regulator of GroEL